MARTTRQSTRSASSRAASSSLSRPATNSPDPAPSGSRVFVELPRLPRSVDRSAYSSPMERDIPSELEPQRILGEYEENGKLSYFAMHADGISHRYDAQDFLRDHPELVSEYKRNKSRGKLAPFDPSAAYVHPSSRIKVTLKLGKSNGLKKALGTSKDVPLIVDSDSGGEAWDEDVPEDGASAVSTSELMSDSDAFIGPASRKNPRRSTRQRTKQTKLPSNPKQKRVVTRASRRSASNDDNGYTEPTFALAPTRRSTRNVKAIRSNLDDDAFTVDSEDGDDDDEYQTYSSRKPAGVSKKRVEKAARPAYGRVRSITDIDLDPLGNPETAPLRAHRSTCEKCSRVPTDQLIKRTRGRKRKDEDEFEEQVGALGGWVRCLKCPLSAHWMCLASTQREEILKAARILDRKEWEAACKRATERSDSPPPEPQKRTTLLNDQTTDFICAMCMKGDICMGCKETVIERDQFTGRPAVASTNQAGVDQNDGDQSSAVNGAANEAGPTMELAFRCVTCRRAAHYSHLPLPEEMEPLDPDELIDRARLAETYQVTNGWSCDDCFSYKDKVEKILAWRPYPENAEQPAVPLGQAPSAKVMLPREYLVKWQDRSYRRCEWVHHGWLTATHSGLLRSYYVFGPRVELLKEAVSEDQVANEFAEGGVGEATNESRESSTKLDGDDTQLHALLGPCPDAERRIPPAWKTIDRILDCRLFYNPSIRRAAANSEYETSEDEDEEIDENFRQQKERAYRYGERPDDKLTETLEDYEEKVGHAATIEDTDNAIWAFIKWDDLGYEDASWDVPPRRGEPGYAAFEAAFEHLLQARKVTVPLLTKSQAAERDNRQVGGYRTKYALSNKAAKDSQPELGQSSSLKLMPFQIEGFDWLCDNWWNKQPCILADEMGLGKTVQICTFVGNVIKMNGAFPVLVVVPNSTITNWVREFTRWAPRLRVVPFYGEAKAREVIKKYELFHPYKEKGTTGAKFHVLVTTYNTITNAKEVASVFKTQPRWEALIIDEGQRLNNDNSLLFRKLKELNALHRIIMTGTPLNNNIRELFNLMNFLDPEKWKELDQLTEQYRDEELTDERVRELHEKLRPYFLRRIKSEVLKLPPKNEVIVPVSLAPLQKEMYKSILSKNINLLTSLAQSGSTSRTRTSSSAASKANMNNMLMQLRKCVQHPYLLSHDIEPKGLAPIEAHERLIGASAKLRLLHGLLPKLKARGHRVLLFSQFVIALDIIEDFLNGESIKYLRLDGNTKQADRQKGMDEFNKPGSDVFVYLLTTRAGGVGINLWSADTVIIFDPDFNPHQDLQAIARAHRYGQQKPCLVFKLMAKDTAEERIFQMGKKKLVLDHLIVQKMTDDENGADVQSILTYGAKTLFEEDDQHTHEIIYNDHDLDNLIERTENEIPAEEPEGESAGQAFSFAKIWTADKDALQELGNTEEQEPADSWAATLQRIADERKKMEEVEVSGRGAKRKAAIAPLKPQQSFDFDDSPEKKPKGKNLKRRRPSAASGDSDGWETPSHVSDISNGSSGVSDEFLDPKHKRKDKGQKAADDDEECGLCGNRHAGPCTMADSSENLAGYRELLFNSSEPYEERRSAIEVIDETLLSRGHIHLIQGQPLYLTPLRARSPPPPAPHTSSTSVVQQPAGSGAANQPSRAPTKRPSDTPVHRSSSSGMRPADGFDVALRKTSPVRSAQVPVVHKPKSSAPPGLTKLRLVEVNGATAGPSRAKGDGATTGVSTTSMGTGTSSASAPPKPRLSTQGVKRPSQAGAGELPDQKRVKSSALCQVCLQEGRHPVRDCPVVARGLPSIAKAVQRLERDGEQKGTVALLKQIERQLKRGERSTVTG